MKIKQLTYKCDCCGRSLSVNISDSLPELPSNWMDMKSCGFGEVCNICFKEFQDIYDRLHAREKAREQYEKDGL